MRLTMGDFFLQWNSIGSERERNNRGMQSKQQQEDVSHIGGNLTLELMDHAAPCMFHN